MKKTRTVEEIRAAARAELPTLKTLAETFKQLQAELQETPEHKRRAELEDEDAEAVSFAGVWNLGATLAELLQDIPAAAGHLDEDTDPAHIERWRRQGDEALAGGEREQRARLRPGGAARVALRARMLAGLRELVHRLETDAEAWSLLTIGAADGGVGSASVEEVLAYVMGGEEFESLAMALPNYASVYVSPETWRLLGQRPEEEAWGLLAGNVRTRFQEDPTAFASDLLSGLKPRPPGYQFKGRPLLQALEAPEGFALALHAAHWDWLHDLAGIVRNASKRAGVERQDVGPEDILELLVERHAVNL